MSRRMMVLIALLSVLATSPRAVATVQDGDICWAPDIEFPTTCDDDDD